MSKKAVSLAVVLAIAASCAAAEGQSAANKQLARIVDENGRIDLLALSKRAKKKKPNVAYSNAVATASFSNSTIVARVGGETLDWGTLKKAVDMQMRTRPLSLPPGATIEDVERISQMAKGKVMGSLVRSFMGSAVLAEVARTAGLRPEDTVVARTNLEAQVLRTTAPKLRGEMKRMLEEEGTYFRKRIDHVMLGEAYVHRVVKPTIAVSHAEVTNAIAENARYIDAVTKHNQANRQRMEDWLKDLRAGKINFEQTAASYSDCDSSEEGGYMGEFEEGDCELLPELKSVAFSIQTNVLSDVIETPYSYNILKVRAKRPPAEDEEGNVIELCQIELDKEEVPAALTEEAARKVVFASKLADAVEAVKAKAKAELRIESLLAQPRKTRADSARARQLKERIRKLEESKK